MDIRSEIKNVFALFEGLKISRWIRCDERTGEVAPAFLVMVIKVEVLPA